MATQGSRLRIKEQAGVHHVEFVDRSILDEANIKQIGDELAHLITNAAEPKFVLSFKNVDHLSSAALGTLITVHNKVKSAKGQLRLCAIDQQILEVFAITKLDTLFEIHDSEDDALASIS